MKSESEILLLNDKLNLNANDNDLKAKPNDEFINSTKKFSLFTSNDDDTNDSNLKNVIEFIESQCKSDRVAIVSIIGKSTLQSNNLKANCFAEWIEQNLFNSKVNEKSLLLKDNFVQIDGYYDVNNHIILLHLTSVLDTCALLDVLENLEKTIVEKSFLIMWPNLIANLIKSLLLIFYVSNTVIITNPSIRFDIGCINMLRIIDSTRIKLQPFVSEMLTSLNMNTNTNINKIILKNTFIMPQLLFIFEAFDGNYDYINDSNIKYYVKQLEEQIVKLFRKTRLINSLFTIPSLNSFVFIQTKTTKLIDYDEFFFKKIFNRFNLDNLNDVEQNQSYFSQKYRQTIDDNMSFSNFIMPHLNFLMKNTKSESSSSMLMKSNNNNNSNNNNELYRVKIFFKLFVAFKELLFKQTYQNISAEKIKNLQQILDSLHTQLDIDNRFSDGRCSKLLPNSINFYKDNLPTHYTRDAHERKLLLTLQHFTAQTRGPAIYDYIKKIQNECQSYWQNGHKMCEELSLSGNYCINKIHRLPHDDFSNNNDEQYDNDSNIPVMPHNSMIKMISACDCGRRQSNRDDPFTMKAANYDFYLKMRYKCHTCRNIKRYKFNVYDTNIDIDNLGSSQNMTGTKSENLRDSPVNMKNENILSSQIDPDSDDKNMADIENSSETHLNDLLLSIDNMSNNDDSISFDNENDSSTNADIDIVGQKQTKSHENDTSQSQSSTNDSNDDDDDDDEYYSDDKEFLTEDDDDDDNNNDNDEYMNTEQHSPTTTTSSSAKEIFDIKTLPIMIHTLLGNNIDLPSRFASWSLVCFGSSSIYSHNLGLQDQQGFVKGSHYLLPWNVTVILQHFKNMPPLWEGKRPPGIKHKKTLNDGTQFTVKIFLGVEYECFNGHRFIASKPDQILKATTHKFKETAESIAQNDMPIYMHCVCSRSTKPCIAQLMRIHIVTPKAPINVTINPMVQMTPNSNLLFYPGNKEPIPLTQSAYWVLRLPMIYGTDLDGPLSIPKEPLPYCRLLNNCYGIADHIVTGNDASLRHRNRNYRRKHQRQH